jgi:hypothetical protein
MLWLPVLALAGCGGSQTHSARRAATAPALSHVFTVPARLPPRAHATPATARHDPGGAAAQPATAGQAASGAPSDAAVQRELAQALGMRDNANVADQAGLDASGLAIPPPSAPAKVAAIITAGNQVARAPYRYGGGHGGVGGKENWVDSAYDCSGSVSFALASAGLVDHQLDSTSFESWGRPGPGKWVTVFANAGHAFMVVAGLRFDTVERARTGTRWGAPYSSVTGFVARHPAGL